MTAGASTAELEYHLLLARELEYLDHVTYGALHTDVTEIKRMLTVFIQRLKADG